MQENTIKLIRSKRKTLSLEINAKGDVLVRAPLRLSKREILAFVNEKSEWIKKH
ncbi:MAG TPA: YgjP-like metallopeptidase domain-containing protein, partial [Lachnospiraceae bacterium]